MSDRTQEDEAFEAELAAVYARHHKVGATFYVSSDLEQMRLQLRGHTAAEQGLLHGCMHVLDKMLSEVEETGHDIVSAAREHRAPPAA